MKTTLRSLLLAVLVLLPALSALAVEDEGPAADGGALTWTLKVINLLLVVGVLVYVGRRPLAAFFAGQRAAIHKEIEQARTALAESQQRLAEVEGRMEDLQQEIDRLRQEAAEKSAAERERMKTAVGHEAERLLATARAEIESAGRAAQLELRAHAAQLAVGLAEQRIRQQLTPPVQAALLEASLAELSAPGDKERA